MPWQFRVVDGADQGRVFPLPNSGVYPIGSSRKHAEIALNDLYVARIHAEVELNGPHIVVVDSKSSPAGTLVNGQKVGRHEIRHGDVVRLGNSHLRLEDVAKAALERPPDEAVADLPIQVLAEESEPAPKKPAKIGFADEKPQKVVAERPAPSRRLQELVGQSLGNFAIEKVIGTGHAGVVFKARDTKSDATVALKVLVPEFPHDDAEMQRYVQTWKLVFPLRHPNLVPIFRLGKTGPYCWLASEWMDRAPLPHIIEHLANVDEIDWHRPFRVAVQIARALEFAHQHHIVHRNITARHILWRTSDKVAKLADLGLAAALQSSQLRTATLGAKLQADIVYYSPEQTDPGNFIDGVCDIYSLGVVIYALLTGRFPCTGATQEETIRSIRTVKPIPPSLRHAEIPNRFEDIVMKMLAKRPEDRYQTPEALLGDLRVVGTEEKVPV